MSPVLVAILGPLISGLLSLLGASKAEEWLVDHALSFVAGYVERYLKLDASWALQGAVSDAASGTVTLTITRSGRTAAVVVLEPLGLTAAHQATIAALLGALFHEAEGSILALFQKAAPTVPIAAHA